ncbi:MAG: alanyl-tRNA editing protein [Candidatus Heimdallarchaeota archaeon]|nr:alanyl-tRNA editing protein [Candidatus Heimdallarchaeota archaeon]
MSRSDLYLVDSYKKELATIVIEVIEGGAVLEQTIFYPQGGGQPMDKGVLIWNNEDYPVIEIKKIDDKLIHLTEHTFSVGDKVTVKIDWDYRYALMKHHTALHILSAVVYRKYQAKVTGGTIYEDKARLDFDLSEFGFEMANDLVEETNNEIRRDHLVEIEFLDREAADKNPELIRTKVNLLPKSINEIRTVKIGDIDLQADGGLHVLKTSEIGEVQLVKIENKGKGRKRISISANLG